PILDAVNAANHATPPVPKTSDTVTKAVAEWREHAATSLKPSTRRSAESHLRRHILPLLGGCPLEDLTVKQMQTFVTALASGQRTAKTIENVLADAVLDSWCGSEVGVTKCRRCESLICHCLAR